jgi:hypothetical protein
MPTNDGKYTSGEHAPPVGDFVNHPNSGPESSQLGYETTDVNVGGIVVFIGGLFGFVIIFFFFCFLMGRVINEALNRQDGPKDKWHTSEGIFAGAKANGGNRENLKSNAAIQQQELGAMTASFPNPRLDVDDGNQATADLHAREDLLLEHYSTVPGQPAIRIPIERAMELIAQKGLPVSTAAVVGTKLAGAEKPVVSVPLTSGFARTGYELDTIEAREQKMAYGKAESSAHAELKPVK